jgi:hypothetical protein
MNDHRQYNREDQREQSPYRTSGNNDRGSDIVLPQEGQMLTPQKWEYVSPPDRKWDQKFPDPPERKIIARPEANIYYAPEPIVEPKKFFVTLEEIVCPGSELWKKKDDVLQPVLVVTDLTENTTIRSFVQKARAAEEKVKEVAKIQRNNTWRVFFPWNLPDPFNWRLK